MNKTSKFLPAIVVFVLIVASLSFLASHFLQLKKGTTPMTAQKAAPKRTADIFFYKEIGNLSNSDESTLSSIGQKYTLSVAITRTQAEAVDIIRKLNVPYECFYIPLEGSNQEEFQINCGMFEKRLEAQDNLRKLKRQNLKLLSKASIKLLD